MEEKKVTGLMKQSEDIVKSLENLFKGFPHLPENAREVLVKIAPILSLVFGVLGLIGGIGVLFASPLAVLGGVRSGFGVFVTGALTIVSSVLMLMAYPKLKNRQYAGWMYLFWSEALNAVYALFMLSVGSVIGVIIGLYILFEVKKHYK